jgi:hypothetical protein
VAENNAPVLRSVITDDYEGRIHHFGVGLSEQEVLRIVLTIRLRFPIRNDWDDVEPLPVTV